MAKPPADPAVDAPLVAHLAPIEDIGAAWIFGSRARGEGRPRSDLDLALLVNAPAADRGVRVLAVGTAFTRALGITVDAVDASRVTPTLGWEIVSSGRPTFARDEERAVEIEVRWVQVWVDTAHMRRVQNHYLYGDPL